MIFLNGDYKAQVERPQGQMKLVDAKELLNHSTLEQKMLSRDHVCLQCPVPIAY